MLKIRLERSSIETIFSLFQFKVSKLNRKEKRTTIGNMQPVFT